MKKYLFTTLAIIISCSETTIDRSDVDYFDNLILKYKSDTTKLANGTIIYKHDNEQISDKMFYINGLLQTEKRWYENGSKRVDSYRDGEIWLNNTWYKNGVREWESLIYGTGKDKYTLDIYYDSLGNRESAYEGKNNKSDGYWKEWDSSGVLWQVKNYVNGLEHGADTFHDSSGALYWMSRTENGKTIQNIFWNDSSEVMHIQNENGLNTYFYENGKIEIQGNLKVNKMVGEWFYYDEIGNINKVINCDIINCKTPRYHDGK